MRAEAWAPRWAPRWAALLGAVLLSTGCVTLAGETPADEVASTGPVPEEPP